MSAIAATYRPSAPAALLRQELAPVMGALAAWGPDGSSETVCPNDAVLGIQKLHATPEDDLDPEPGADGAADVVLDGRIDNRAELLAALGAPRGGPWSDTELARRVYHRWGSEGFARVIGDFALIVYDRERRELHAYRDPLGDRPLYVDASDDGCRVATSSHALVAGDRRTARLDLGRVASYLGLTPPAPRGSFFAHVDELAPGSLLTATPDGTTTRALRRVTPRHIDAPPARYPELVREALREAIRGRLRSRGPTAISLSSGIDSGLIAALAANVATEPLLPVSWSLPDLPDADEGVFVAALADALALPATAILGDDCWPLRLPDDFALEPGTPETNMYRRLKQRLYDAARARGARTILTGNGADELVTAQPEWLWSAARRGELGRAARLAREHAARFGLSRRVLRQLVRAAGLRRPAALRDPPRPRWLSPLGWELARDAARESVACAFPWVDGPTATKSALAESVWAHRRGFELRHPFRDLRLIELVLGLPADEVETPSQPKALLRAAANPVLPKADREARRRGMLYALYDRGAAREATALAAELAEPCDELRALVDERWLASARAGRLPTEREEVALWNCSCFQRWRTSP